MQHHHSSVLGVQTPVNTTRPQISETMVPLTDTPNLPLFTPVTDASFIWGEHCADESSMSIDATYEEVMEWRKNLYPVPPGTAGKAF